MNTPPVILWSRTFFSITGGIKHFIIYLEMVHSGEVTKIKLKMAQLFLIMDFLTPMTLNFYFPSHEVIFCQFPVIASTMVITKCVDSLLFSLIQFVMIQPFFRLNLRHQQQYTRRTLEPSTCIHHQKLLPNKA